MGMLFYKQHDSSSCGIACLRMIYSYYGIDMGELYLRKFFKITNAGIFLSDFIDTLKKLDFSPELYTAKLKELPVGKFDPFIALVQGNHYIIIYEISQNKLFHNKEKKLTLSDPAKGKRTMSISEFEKEYLNAENAECYTISLSKPQVEQKETASKQKSFLSWNIIKEYKSFYLGLLMNTLVSGIISGLIPYCTQMVVDYGIEFSDLNFSIILLLTQGAFGLGYVISYIIKDALRLSLSNAIGLDFITTFITKIVKLPIPFFESRTSSDVYQRMFDYQRVQSFLSETLVLLMSSLVMLMMYLFLMSTYSMSILIVFGITSILQIAWGIIFFKRRQYIDDLRFTRLSKGHEFFIELVDTIKDIKIYGLEKIVNKKMTFLQKDILDVNKMTLRLDSIKNLGETFLDQVKIISILYISVSQVINNELSLGMMMAIQFVIGQVNMPIKNILSFINDLQDTQLSLDRLKEISREHDEDHNRSVRVDNVCGNIKVQDIDFNYTGSDELFKSLNFEIPQGKTTAIVGGSGSGKSTVLKLLLGFNTYQKGSIQVGDKKLHDIAPSHWRKLCGAVLQDSQVFSASIKDNVTMFDPDYDQKRLFEALQKANLFEYVRRLPHKEKTMIGSDGILLSTGQMQRIFIARIFYKNPKYIILDEATNALDTSNEKSIMSKFNSEFEGKTVIVVAHRLSTIKNADQILIIDQGEIVGKGTHAELIESNIHYQKLIQNQL